MKNNKGIQMYRLEINGCFSGSFNTAGEAMEAVEKQARPFGHSWVIHDPYGKVYAQG